MLRLQTPSTVPPASLISHSLSTKVTVLLNKRFNSTGAPPTALSAIQLRRLLLLPPLLPRGSVLLALGLALALFWHVRTLAALEHSPSSTTKAAKPLRVPGLTTRGQLIRKFTIRQTLPRTLTFILRIWVQAGPVNIFTGAEIKRPGPGLRLQH